MKKIGIFCGYYLPHLGGVERYVNKLGRALHAKGYQIVIVTSNHGELKNTEKTDFCTIYRLPTLSFAKNRYPIPRRSPEYTSLIEKIQDEKIDYFLLNTRFHLTSLVGARIGKQQKRPVMMVEHGTDHFTVNNKVLDFFGLIYEHVLTAYLKRKIDKYYGVSKKCNEWLKHFSIKASGVFYNAIDLTDAPRVKDLYDKQYPSDEVVLCFAGRLIKEKGILNLLDAYTDLQNERGMKKVKLVVAGDGDLLTYIKEKYQHPSIYIAGKLDFEHMMALFKRSDIFVHPSQYPEGLPTSILEAGLMKCAAIVTPRGGTEEVITHNRHGIIIDGSVESIHESIEQLIDNPKQREELAGALQKRVKDVFNWGVVAENVDKEIKSFEVR